MNKPLIPRDYILLLLLVCAAFALDVTNNGFPLGYHSDEPTKVGDK